MDCHIRTHRKFDNRDPAIYNSSFPIPSTTNLVTISQGGVREIPEAMLDPYSVLGVLSFGVYIFYILYTRYRMRGGHHNPTSPQNNNGGQQPQTGGTLFSADAQENIANIIKMATNIISNAPYLGASNSTFESDDYFDTGDGSDLRRKLKIFRK